jgi:hypothetical protein
MEFRAFIAILSDEVVIADHWRRLVPELQEDKWRLTAGPCQRAAERLRELIGMWIASGDQPNGIELPKQRSCKDWKEDELVNTPFRIAPNLGSLAIRRTHESITAQSKTARDTATVFLDDGTVMVLPTIPGFVAEETLLVMAWVRFWQHLRWSIVRCHLCGKYESVPKVKASYTCGWHHRRCRQKRGATDSRKKMLQDCRDTLLHLASIAYRKADGRRQEREQETYFLIGEIVERVNDEVAKLNAKPKGDAKPLVPGESAREYRRITRNLVTRNMKTIREGATRGKS